MRGSLSRWSCSSGCPTGLKHTVRGWVELSYISKSFVRTWAHRAGDGAPQMWCKCMLTAAEMNAECCTGSSLCTAPLPWSYYDISCLQWLCLAVAKETTEYAICVRTLHPQQAQRAVAQQDKIQQWEGMAPYKLVGGTQHITATCYCHVLLTYSSSFLECSAYFEAFNSMWGK